jgi:hypothetical protein
MDTFPLFSRFPDDIRLLIWEFALPSRIVCLECDNEYISRCSLVWSNMDSSQGNENNDSPFFELAAAGGQAHEGPRPFKYFYIYNPPPDMSLFFVCRESYEIASGSFSKAFGTSNH